MLEVNGQLKTDYYFLKGLTKQCFEMAEEIDQMNLSELLKMEVWEYNHWVGYFMHEREEQETASMAGKQGKYR